MNQSLAGEVVERLRAAGVRTFCLCPGGRNAPLVEALEATTGVEVLDFFEERSAGFFAVGRARRDARPVAVITTSGTAAAELLPALIEAYYSGVPLVAVTADRPRSYRGTGAPQAIEQRELFGTYARPVADLEVPGSDWSVTPDDGPSHVNVSFDEPLLGGWQDGQAPRDESCGSRGPDIRGRGEEAEPEPDCVAAALVDAAARALHGCSRPLVLLGALASTGDRDDALAFCQRLGGPVLAEASSHLWPRLGAQLLRDERAARRGFDARSFDSVVRIGDVPSCRLWRDLETALRVPILSLSRRPWPGLTRGVHLQVEVGARLSTYLPRLEEFPQAEREAVTGHGARLDAATRALLDEFPLSEPSQVRRLSRVVPPGSLVYLGNSQPIREWNQFAAGEDRGYVYGGNRGANGIDGQLSTFLGSALPDRENWAIVGDLTALYDLAAPWALAHVGAPVRVVVLNNGGGRIFERLFRNPRFQNRHARSFEGWAATWGMDYCRDVPQPWASRAGIVEIRPDEGQTAAFWRAFDTAGE